MCVPLAFTTTGCALPVGWEAGIQAWWPRNPAHRRRVAKDGSAAGGAVAAGVDAGCSTAAGSAAWAQQRSSYVSNGRLGGKLLGGGWLGGG